MKLFYKKFTLKGLSVTIFWMNEFCGIVKTDILIDLNSGSYIFTLAFAQRQSQGLDPTPVIDSVIHSPLTKQGYNRLIPD